jgi:hypothetical protein
MSETTSVSNRNFLSPLNFKFQLKRAPHVNFFIQKVNIPSISLPTFEVPNPLLKVPFAAVNLDYSDLSITFKVDEDLQNYMEIHDWIRALGKPSFQEYSSLKANTIVSGDGLKSDIALTVLTSNKNANYQIVFKDSFPTNLSDLEFDTTDEDIDYLTVTATFRYYQFDILKVT